MTVTYHSGRRIQGTQADFDGTPAVSGGWKELGRTTLGSAGDDITVSSLPDKRYYMILSNSIPTGNVDFAWRTGNGSVDTGNNYASRSSQDGGAEVTSVNTNRIRAGLSGTISAPQFHMGFWSNLSSKEKLFIGHSMGQNAAGAGTAPTRRENVGKWTSTSNPLDTLTATDAGAGSHNTGSELVVLGWDPDDTHTDNFWEELASVELGTTADSFDTGTFTAKKYLWVQVFTKGSGAVRAGVRLGNSTIDTGANYAIRRSHNGAADSTFTSGTFGVVSTSGATSNDNEFINMFIINNASNEKLAISHYNRKNTSGAANAPNRGEIVGKWANTSNQCNIIQVHNDQSGDFVSGSFIKVWGSN